MSLLKRERGSAPTFEPTWRVLLLGAITALFLQAPDAEARRRHVQERYSPAASAMAIDLYSGRILYAKNPNEPRYPASITKVMTLYLLFDALRDGRLTMGTRLQVSEHAAEQSPTKLGLSPGETIAVSDVIGAIVTKSANDMAVTVAEALAGSEEEFARVMTQKARTIGMLNTTFRNASGLPNSEQTTTALDLIILGKSILADHPQRARVFATRYFQYNGEIYRNHNTMLFSYEGMEGMKTGFTAASGFNLLASAHRGDKRVLAVVLGGGSASSRNATMRNILDASWSKALTRTAAQKAGVQASAVVKPFELAIAVEQGRAEEPKQLEAPKRLEPAPAETPQKKDAVPVKAVSAAAPAASAPPQAILQLKQQPDSRSIGMLIASIENGLVAKHPFGRPETAQLSSDMTTDEPEEKIERAASRSSTHVTAAPRNATGNETWVAEVQHAQLQNLSVHNKTARQLEVEPLAAVAVETTQAADLQAVKTADIQPVKAQAEPAGQHQKTSQPQTLAAASVAVSKELQDQPGPYHVQVGSFPDQAQARQRLESVKQALGSALMKAHPEFIMPVALPSGVTMYRARLGRFSDDVQAKAACKKLKQSGIDCWEIRAQ